MKKINLYSIQKRFVECLISIAVLSFGLFVFFYYLIKNRIFLKKTIFKRANPDKKQIFYVFNTTKLLFQNIPLFYYILKGNLHLVGLKQENKALKEGIGICNLWFIRRCSKMPNISIEQCDKEYLDNKTILYDLKIVVKSCISLIYHKRIYNYHSKIKLFDIVFDNLSLDKILEKVQVSIDANLKTTVYFVNADCLNKSLEDESYKNVLLKANYILPDGSGVNMACNIINNPLKENLNGTDLFPHICSLAQNRSYKIYLFGAKDTIAQTMKNKLLKEYKSLKIVGIHNGYIKEKEIQGLIENINQSKADILFVALGAPQQELFIEKYKDKINAKLILGVGGLFDFYSNKINRAPLFIREIGFEWIYRMLQEPKRMWKRYIIGNPKFLYRVYQYKKNSNQNKLIDSYLKNYEDSFISFKYKNLFWNLKLNCSSFFKRAMDILVSSVMLMLLLPLFCITALFIRFESKGAILFSQTRIGLNAKKFKMYKFRSMIDDASKLKEQLVKENESKDGVIFKMKDDPRITRVGKVIRKTSIDELPQLYNVLIGQMSLVGPRPPLQSEVELYSIEERKRLDVKPGITCIWQVSGRSNIPFKQQVLMDKKYIKEHGFIYDIVLLLKTIPAVLFSKGSY